PPRGPFRVHERESSGFIIVSYGHDRVSSSRVELLRGGQADESRCLGASRVIAAVIHGEYKRKPAAEAVTKLIHRVAPQSVILYQLVQLGRSVAVCGRLLIAVFPVVRPEALGADPFFRDALDRRPHARTQVK